MIGVLTGALGPGATGGVSFATRTFAHYNFGSSTRVGQNSDFTVDARGGTAPAAFVNKTPVVNDRDATLPNGAATAPLIVESAASGRGPSTIKQNVLDAISAGTLNASTTLNYYTGVNDPAVQEVARYQFARDTLTAVNGVVARSFYATTNLYSGTGIGVDGSSNQVLQRQNFRMARAVYDLNDPNHSWGDYTRGGILWDGSDGYATRITADVVQQMARMTPWTITSSDKTHPLGYGYYNMVKYCDVPHLEAWGDGPCHFPYMPHYFKISATGTIGRLHFTGDLAGSTITVNTPGFSIAKVAGRPILSCSVLPTFGIVELSVTTTKNGLSRTSVIPISVSSRAGTAIAPVRYKGNNGHIDPTDATLSPTSALTLPTTSTKFCLVWIGQFEEDDGLNPLLAAGTSDTRVQTIVGNNSTTALKRTASGTYGLTLPAVGSGNVIAATISGTRRKDHGRHAIFIEIDTVAGTALSWLSSGTLISNGSAYAGSADAGVSMGTPTASAAVDFAKFFACVLGAGAIANIPTSLAIQFFNGVKGRLWVADNTIGFTDPAKRALFFDPATRLPVDSGGSTVSGVTPLLDLRGDAAETANGAWLDNAPEAALGGSQVKNFGSAGAFTHWSALGFSSLETLPAWP